MPTGRGLGDAVRRGKAIGCTAIQVFTSSPQQWKAKEPDAKVIADFKQAQAETGISAVVSHDSYLVNLCAPNPEIRAKSLAGLKGELQRCSAYGIRYAVSHIGAHMGQGEEEGLRIAAEGLLEVLKDSPDDTMILAETTAGQGSALNYRFEQLGKLIELCHGHPRLGVCLDTCHVFAAGYDLSTESGYAELWAEFDQTIGLERLKAIHCNDSKKPLGSRVDRHEHLGKGCIGLRCFELLVNDPRFAQVPILVETPEAETMHEANVKRLWEFIAG